MLKHLSLLLLLSLTLSLLACGGAAPSRSADQVYSPAVGGVDYNASYDREIRAEMATSSDDADGEALFDFAKAKADPKRAAPSGGNTGVKAPVAATPLDQRLVKNAWMTIQLKDEDDFTPAVEKAQAIARKMEGYVTNSTTSSISMKVPTGRLDEALAALTALGKVKDKDVSVVDVTANYVDLQIRIDNLKSLRDRLQELVKQGQNVKEILEVEKELARVTSQLEALEGQMRVLSNQTTFATIAVSFQERVLPGPLGWIFYGAYKGIKWLFVWD